MVNSNSKNLSEEPKGSATLFSQVKQNFNDTKRDHYSIYAIAIFTFLLAIAVGSYTKVGIDFSIFLQFTYYLSAAAIFLATGLSAVKFCNLAFVEKSDQPTKELIKHLAVTFNNPPKIAGTLHMFIAFVLFACGFSVLRSSVGVLNPYDWDIYFRDLDRLIHFGFLPHELIGGIIDNPYAIAFVNLIYNTWYFVMLASIFTAGILTQHRHTKLQFLNAFFLVWLVLGFFMATGFSSAGPCYFQRLDFGTDYNDLMASLNKANTVIPIWALPIQDLLWDGYIGARSGSVGITAFPSIHVATSVLIAIAGSKISRNWGITLWIYAALIMLGSFALGWHYAVDGYASAILVPFIWWFAGKIVRPTKNA